MNKITRTLLCAPLLVLCAVTAGAGLAHAGETETENGLSARERAAALPISAPTQGRSAPRAGAIPMVGERAAQAQTQSRSTRVRSNQGRWPQNARPFAAASSSRAATTRAASTRAASTRAASTRPTSSPAARAAKPVAIRPAPSSASGSLPSPQVRRSSPSYAELARSRPTHVLARPAGVSASNEIRPTRRRATRRGSSTTRTTRARRAVPQARCAPPALTVPLAPGQQPQRIPTRGRMDFRPPPGQTCYG